MTSWRHKTLLRLTPKTAAAPGATACTAASIPAMATDDPVELAAMAVKLKRIVVNGQPDRYEPDRYVDAQGNTQIRFTAAPASHPLDKTCDWEVAFAPEDDWCLASARVKDLAGESVGSAVAGVAFYGGSPDADGRYGRLDLSGGGWHGYGGWLGGVRGVRGGGCRGGGFGAYAG